MKSLKKRAGRLVRRLFASARSSSRAISALSREFCCNPNKKCTRFASHQAINSSRANPLSPRNRMRTFGQRQRICAMMRAISSTAPEAASALPGRSLAANKCRPQKM
jgi:Tfp pilus assembly pilus retraction ATPase PilT